MLVGQYIQDQTGIYTGHICTGHILDMDWTMYRTKHRTSHFGQTHFEQGQGQDLKQFGVDRGQGKWPKLGIWKLATHMTMGIWADRSFISKAYGQ